MNPKVEKMKMHGFALENGQQSWLFQFGSFSFSDIFLDLARARINQN